MPDTLRSRVLDLLREQGRPVAVRELVRRLGLAGPERRELKTLLRELIGAGELVKIRGSRVGLPSRMNLVVGRLTCNPAGYGFVKPERPGQPDVYVGRGSMKEALHGDRVVVRLERSTPKGPEGRVIRILERALQRIVGRFEEEGRFGVVIPFDRRVLHELFVPAEDTAGARAGEMVAAEMTRPPTATRSPSGRVLERLGFIDDAGVDLKVIVAKYSLPDAFPDEVEAEAGATPDAVRPEDLEGRRDFRDRLTVTVDPATAKDHDDAVGLERLAGGGWRLHVHIADVAHYVPEGGALDQEAYLRGTSVYFPDRVVPMLPHALSSGICSLVEGEDRLCQSAVIDFDAKGRVERAEFADGVIRSDARLSYQEAQAIVDGDAALRKRHAPLVDMLLEMDVLAKKLRKLRHARGSLDFDLPEPKLVLSESGEMTGIVATARLDSMRVVEECMLAANEAVAARLTGAAAPALFRVHEAPDVERVEEFCELVASLGYRVPTNLGEIRAQDFQRVLRQIEGKPEERLVSYLLLRTMKLAVYHEDDLGHFGLATASYTHFTSPIRRYPDLVAHRALRGLRSGRSGDDQQKRELLPEMARHLSEMERRAAEAERELIEWKKVRFMADKLGDRFNGYVTGVQSFGLFVELEEVFVQGLVHVSSMNDDYYAFDERRHTLTGENTGNAYRLGDRVEIQLVKADLDRRQLDFALVDVLERAAGSPQPPRGGRKSRPATRPASRSPRRGRRGG